MGLRKKLKKLNKRYDALELKRMKIEAKQDKIGKRINKLEDKFNATAAFSVPKANDEPPPPQTAPPKKKNYKKQTPIKA